MVEEKAFAGIERCDSGHIFIGKCEIKNVDVLLHPFDVGGLGDDDDTPLYQPAKRNLSDTFAVFATDFSKHRIGEEVVSSFGERSP